MSGKNLGFNLPDKIKLPIDYKGSHHGFYTFKQKLNSSSHSEVHLMDRDNLVCKIIPKIILTTSKKVKMLTDELSIHQSITHPYIVQSYFTIEDPSNYYLFMEYCRDGTLETYVKKRGTIYHF